MGGSLSEPLMQRYTRDITRALAYLHHPPGGEEAASPIVHGDVKCHNILIGQTGAKLADFGTAWQPQRQDRGFSHAHNHAETSSASKDRHEQGEADKAAGPGGVPAAIAAAAGAAASVTSWRSPRGMRGTVSYMSPEVAREEAGQGTAIDIWSLGCTILEMASGRPPWKEIEGGPYAVMFAIGCTNEMPTVRPLDTPEKLNRMSSTSLKHRVSSPEASRPMAAVAVCRYLKSDTW